MPRRLPTVTLLLIAANLIAAFFLLFQPSLISELGFRPDAPRLRAVLTSLFLHANVFHLLGNLIFLAVVGAAVEIATGSFRFASVYFLSGIIAAMMHFLITRQQAEPAVLIGASGSIAGCAGYYSVRYQGLKVPVTPNWSVSVAAITGLWLGLQVLGAFVKIGEGLGGTSYWAHLGGFGTGILLSLIFRAPDVGQVRLSHELLDKMQDRSPAAIAAAARQHLMVHPHDPHALRQLADAMNLQNDSTGEISALVGLLDAVPEEEQPEVIRRICESGKANALTTLRRTILAEKFKETDPECAILILKTVVTGNTEDIQRPEAMLALAGLEREREPEIANRLLRELLNEYPMHPTVELARKRGWI